MAMNVRNYTLLSELFIIHDYLLRYIINIRYFALYLIEFSTTLFSHIIHIDEEEEEEKFNQCLSIIPLTRFSFIFILHTFNLAVSCSHTLNSLFSHMHDFVGCTDSDGGSINIYVKSI